MYGLFADQDVRMIAQYPLVVMSGQGIGLRVFVILADQEEVIGIERIRGMLLNIYCKKQVEPVGFARRHEIVGYLLNQNETGFVSVFFFPAEQFEEFLGFKPFFFCPYSEVVIRGGAGTRDKAQSRRDKPQEFLLFHPKHFTLSRRGLQRAGGELRRVKSNPQEKSVNKTTSYAIIT
jgi:hypothetical protein